MKIDRRPILPPPEFGPRPCALVVDDSASQRQLLSVFLSRCDLDVMTVGTPEEALELCQTEAGAKIRIVISDWQMPGMDGPDFCRAFRQIDRGDYAYFILMTSSTDNAAKTRGLDAGADDFLRRPVDMAELRARIAAGRRILDMQEKLLHRNHEVLTANRELQSIQDSLSRDLAEARKLQRAFLPPRHHTFGHGAELSLNLVTCDQIGGDLVGYFPVSAEELAIFSIDVSGHGIASALLTGRLAELFAPRDKGRNVAFPRGGAPADPPHIVVSRLNDFMLQDLTSDIYFTMVLAYLNTETGLLRLCQAGHPHPLVRRADGQVARLGDGGPPVGMLPGATFEDWTTTLTQGDLLLTYSDGLTECTNTWGDMLEEEGLMNVMRHLGPDTEAGVTAIEAALSDHVGFNAFDDDLSLILLRF